MNKRIRELAHQAGYNWIKFDSDYKEERGNMLSQNTAYGLERFAELIVRECMDIISDESGKVSDEWRCKDGKHIWWKIKEHFGVEDLKPCKSPYCECDFGKCSHPGFYDARGEE